MGATPATGSTAAPGSSPAAGDPAAGADSATVVDAVLRASRVLVAVAARSLADLAEEVTLPQYRTLVILAGRGPQRVIELAEALGVAPPTVTRMCDRLVRKGLVRRRAGRRDRRLVLVSLTPAGSRLVAEVTRRRQAEIARLLEGVSAEDQQQMVTLFHRLADAAGEVPEPDWSAGWEL